MTFMLHVGGCSFLQEIMANIYSGYRKLPELCGCSSTVLCLVLLCRLCGVVEPPHRDLQCLGVSDPSFA